MARAAKKRKQDESRLIQARIPAELYQRVKAAADAETISIAAYVRRTLKNMTPGG